MAATNKLFAAPPHPVERALKAFGTNLRRARIRRKMTIEDVAARIGTGLRAVRDTEQGKLSTGVAVYLALLWVYGCSRLSKIWPIQRRTKRGSHKSASERARARKSGAFDNDF